MPESSGPERTYVSLEEEAAEAAQVGAARVADEFKLFLTQWPQIEDMPFCYDGMRLLFEVSRRAPLNYEIIRRTNFVDLSHPSHEFNKAAAALVAHAAACADCNESGEPNRTYHGARHVPPSDRQPN